LEILLRSRIYITCGVNADDLFELRLRDDVPGRKKLQRRLIALSALTGCLLLGFVLGKAFVEMTFTLAAAHGFCAVDTERFCDEVLVDLVVQDHAPFAEGLHRHQQDE